MTEYRPQRFEQLRATKNISQATIAHALGITEAWANDLEQDDDELLDLDLSQVNALARLLGCSMRDLLADERGPFPPDTRDFAWLSSLTAEAIGRAGSRSAFEDLLGWQIGPFPERPEALWSLPTLFLIDLCTALGVDWRLAIPREVCDVPVTCRGVLAIAV